MNQNKSGQRKPLDFPAFLTYYRAAILTSLLTASGLHAATISIPLGSSLALINTTNRATTYCSVESSPASCSYEDASASASLSNGGSAQASSETNTSLAASSSTIYGIAVTGPGTSAVPIVITGTSTASNSTSTTSVGVASISVLDDNLADYTGYVVQYFTDSFGCSQIEASSSIPLPCTSPGAYTFTTSLIPGSLYFVELTAAAAGGNSAFATIDPQIEIDPSFANASNYTLVASPGVFDSTPVVAPEPGTFGLLAIALSGIVTIIHKVRKGLQRLSSGEMRTVAANSETDA